MGHYIFSRLWEAKFHHYNRLLSVIKSEQVFWLVRDAQMYSTQDSNGGHWKVEIFEAEREKAGFTSQDGLHQFIRLPFSLWNGPATFQHVINMLQSIVNWKYELFFCSIYIVVFSKTSTDYVEHKRSVLRPLNVDDVALKLKEYTFFSIQINYLVLVIKPEKLEAAEHTADAFRKLQILTEVADLRLSLEHCIVFRLSFSNFARIASSLSDKLFWTQARELVDFTGRSGDY